MSDPDATNEPAWRGRVQDWMTRTAASLDDAIDVRWRNLERRLGIAGRAQVRPYDGYANRERVWVGCRVLADKPGPTPDEDDGWWDNLLATYARIASDEVPDVTVELTLNGTTATVSSDHEGYAWFDVPLASPLDDRDTWHRASLRIVDSPIDADPNPVPVGVLSPTPHARFGVISDMDDTVLFTGVTSLLTAARLTFLDNARTRKPLPGVAGLYRSLSNNVGAPGPGRRNPIFYVSSSAWNLHDLLVDFLELNDIPEGPLLLQDLGFDENRFFQAGHDHKKEKALRILEAYPDLPFILIGDSGQEDGRLYRDVVARRPGQVSAVYIRDVDPGERSERDALADERLEQIRQHDVPALRVEASDEIAAHATTLGLIDADQVPSIERDADRDRERRDPDP